MKKTDKLVYTINLKSVTAEQVSVTRSITSIELFKKKKKQQKTKVIGKKNLHNIKILSKLIKI